MGHGSWTSAALAPRDAQSSRSGRLITALTPPASSHHCRLTPPRHPEQLTVQLHASTCRVPYERHRRHRQRSMSVTVNNRRTANLSECQRRAERKVIASLTRRPCVHRRTSALILTVLDSVANRRHTHSSRRIQKATSPTLQ